MKDETWITLLALGALGIGAYYLFTKVKDIFKPVTDAAGGIGGGITNLLTGVLPSTPGQTIGFVPGATIGLFGGGLLGAPVGGYIGTQLAPKTPGEVPGFVAGGAAGGIGGLIGMATVSQLGKALSPVTMAQAKAQQVGLGIGGLFGVGGLIAGAALGKALTPVTKKVDYSLTAAQKQSNVLYKQTHPLPTIGVPIIASSTGQLSYGKTAVAIGNVVGQTAAAIPKIIKIGGLSKKVM